MTEASTTSNTTPPHIHVSERDYLEHEVAALYDAMHREDTNDVRCTIATLQQILHILSLTYSAHEACARLYMDNGGYVLPDREREKAAQR